MPYMARTVRVFSTATIARPNKAMMAIIYKLFIVFGSEQGEILMDYLTGRLMKLE